MLDDGNTRTIMNDTVREELAVPGYAEHVTMQGVHGHSTSQMARVSCVKIESLDGLFQKLIPVLCSTKEILPNTSAVDWSRAKEHWAHLHDIPVAPLSINRVDMMIGNDQVDLMSSLLEVMGEVGEPVARLTKLGWTIAGPLSKKDIEFNKKLLQMQSFATDTVAPKIPRKYQSPEVRRLDDYMTELFRSRIELDDLEPDDGLSMMSLVNRKVLRKLRESIQYVTVDGETRIQARCLWKDGEPKLPNNYGYALKRMEDWERHKSVQDEPSWNAYRDKLMSHVDKGQVVEVTDKPTKHPFYLPHFGVFKEDPITKAKVFDRVVFDGKAGFMNKSLNDAIHEGPNLANDLLKVFTRFRQHPFALGSDIKEMFLNILLYPEDQEYHRFLFRPERRGEVREFKFTRHAFGNRGSPCVANFVLRHHAESKAKEFPAAVQALCESTLMDDTLVSVRTIEEGKKLVRDLQAICGEIGMFTHKMASNAPEILEDILPERRAKQFHLMMTEDKDTEALLKTLGMMWLAKEDVLQFKPMTNVAKDNSMRCYLSVLNALYDPEAIVSPFTLCGRFVLRQCWERQLTWDAPAPDEIIQSWKEWERQLVHLSQIQIPRCLSPALGDVTKNELHFFCDASKSAYGVVSYYRTVYASGHVEVRWMVARNRLAPLKPALSIPRLELKGAELAVQLFSLCSEALKVPVEDCHFHTDSACVLIWLTSTTTALSGYVARRADKIQEKTKPENWHWVDTLSNPADVASRGCSLEELIHHTLWWQGPDYLRQKEILYPVLHDIKPSNEELEVKSSSVLQAAVLRETKVFSRGLDLKQLQGRNWFSTVGIVARVLQIARFWAKRAPSPNPSSKTRIDAEHLLLRSIQLAGYPEDMERLQEQGRVKRSSKLHNFRPSLDDNGVMHASGRLKNNSRCPDDLREPILLPKHEWTEKIIADVHARELYHACGVAQTFSTLRRRFNIQGGRTTVRKVINQCVNCKRLRPKPTAIQEGLLPWFRVPKTGTGLQPFEVTAIDCAGPISVPVGRGKVRKKMYLLVLTCTVYRCTNIQVLSSLDTDSFLMAMTAFVHSCGRPKEMVSDNGSNFRSGCSVWRSALQEIDDEKIRERFPDISWHFGPAYAPFYTGIVERVVQKAKRAINAVLAEAGFNEDQLRVAAVIASSIINNHPLAYELAANGEPSALTPSHFMHGTVMRDIAPLLHPDMSMPKRWLHLQTTMQHYWERFMSEIIPELNKFHSKTTNNVSFKTGDVVIMLDVHQRGEYPLGVVVESPVGSDGVARIVNVRHNGTIFQRHPRTLCRLVAVDNDKKSLEDHTDSAEADK